ncbi:Site-specific recombinase, phage integrase family [uncultured Paludibacter sp.]|jgi:integrase|uniref:Site-specific recombinase, phage integrase family n=1 Tax=uncultured Paludibacter sp. TaxID=497635 RepID=A0A653ACG4_9BACT|nr:Site-specific recombinase, phage integrase family [uncultured Paludibacter sp.]
MKKKLAKTKCTVKLRKSEYHNEWYLILESYPVFNGTDKPQRIIEALNRTITSPVWDKTRTARTSADGSKTFKPKRDVNGIIQCKSTIDQEACVFADGVRSIRQKEYDNADLYTEKEAELAVQNQRQQIDFIEYFSKVSKDRHRNSSQSIIINWNRVAELLKLFTNSQPLPFSQVTLSKAEEFRRFMLSAPCGGKKTGTVSHNTAATYYSIFKAGLKQAFIDGYLTVDISAKIKGIQDQESRREHLSVEELNILAETPCDRPILKRAALFSALTGVRHCDIQKLKWKEIQVVGEQVRLNFTQQKTKGVEYMPISEQAYQLCGEPGKPEQLVFEDLPDPSWISGPLKRWIKSAGITRNITFHCFRHTYATLQLAGGTDIYTVSKMLGHTNVKTTQIYAKVVDEKKQKATKAIKLNITPD